MTRYNIHTYNWELTPGTATAASLTDQLNYLKKACNGQHTAKTASRENKREPRKAPGLKDQHNSWEYNNTGTNQQLEEQRSQKQLDSRRYRGRGTTPRLEVPSLQKQHTADYQNRSGHQSCERRGVTRALNHTRYQLQYETEMITDRVRKGKLPGRSITHGTRSGHRTCERMEATQPLHHTQCSKHIYTRKRPLSM
ncbi:hypothetical protein F511_11227 [Dorcoceras hygrometricum]|uniref:Uncharacterized protein n=1 Tax=Dorcoceras hygrometricum TaxID=472368 RepID=A0A2Z7DHN6_9LAMI|nr:hypothetical protein F511_11227 [Dorcoceras hygrometricum]